MGGGFVGEEDVSFAGSGRRLGGWYLCCSVWTFDRGFVFFLGRCCRIEGRSILFVVWLRGSREKGYGRFRSSRFFKNVVLKFYVK